MIHSDGDGILDDVDNFSFYADPGRVNNDGVAQGDACDTDDDNDGVLDVGDNCPFIDNPVQENCEGGGLGDICDLDDDDGVLDAQDQCSLSNLEATVIIDGCDSGIGNVLLDDPLGCNIGDEIAKLVDGAKSHGQFVSRVDKFLLKLQKTGVLAPNQKHAIKVCTSQSSLP